MIRHATVQVVDPEHKENLNTNNMMMMMMMMMTMMMMMVLVTITAQTTTRQAMYVDSNTEALS
jgi:hypothetical protein